MDDQILETYSTHFENHWQVLE